MYLQALNIKITSRIQSVTWSSLTYRQICIAETFLVTKEEKFTKFPNHLICYWIWISDNEREVLEDPLNMLLYS